MGTPAPRASPQTTSTILMVRPSAFGYNNETAANNAFQRYPGDLSPTEINQKAQEEFDAFVKVLRKAGIEVVVKNEVASSSLPDSVFPNNWVSFHGDGTIITYPMFSALRRKERREDILKEVSNRFGFSHRLHLEKAESEGKFLEGTGSMILDRPNRIVYACLSSRTNTGLLEEFCAKRKYNKVVFLAVDAKGMEIYHTNVMMAVGTSFVVICLDAVPDPRERKALTQSFAQTNKEIIEISMPQMEAFAGNMLELQNREWEPILVMSEQAYRSLRPDQIQQINRYATPIYSPLSTIETYGGGSARCMMAEVFLPENY